MKKAITAIVISSVLISLFAAAQLVEVTVANPINQKAVYEIITMECPQNITYSSDSVSLVFKCQTNFVASYLAYCYTIDGVGTVLYGKVWAQMLKTEQSIISQTVISNDTPSFSTDPYLQYTDYVIEIKATLSSLRDGNHQITLYSGPNYEYSGAVYTPLCNAYFTINTSSDGTKTLRLFRLSPDVSPTPSPLISSSPSISPTQQPTVESTPIADDTANNYTLIVISFSLLALTIVTVSLFYFKRHEKK